jgi:hypothetical protein
MPGLFGNVEFFERDPRSAGCGRSGGSCDFMMFADPDSWLDD